VGSLTSHAFGRHQVNGRKLVAAVLIFALSLNPAFASIESVQVTGGKLQGKVESDVSVFKGIPFAAPPVGSLRWKTPQPVIPWSGTRSAENFAPQCMQQWDRDTDRPSEDCLYLNVWTTASTTRERLPVMVWIHGGGFSGGMSWETLSHGTTLAREGVVLVSIAYRLGAFGFLTHPDLARESGQGAGNYGLFDIVAALEWVQKNIEQFGGDPTRVTIFGGSSGAAAVSLLVGSPMAKGLFSRAIAQGGAALFVESEANLREHDKQAEALGVKTFQSLQAADLAAARAIAPDALLKATHRWPPEFGPVMDGRLVQAGNATQFSQSRFNDTPILIGYTSDEAGDQTIDAVKWARDELNEVPCKEVATSIRKIYSLDDDAKAAIGMRFLFRDLGLGLSTWMWARLHAEKARNPGYVYFFDAHDAAHPHGAPHSSEYSHVFGNFPHAASSAERSLSALVRKYWINFASTGNPNGLGLPEWKKFDEQSQEALVLDATPSSQRWPGLEGIHEFDALDTCAKSHVAGTSP
jgi:para-nitrobenzyl esterase